MPVVWKVLWAPDSNAFALKTKLVGHPSQQGVEVLLPKRRNLSKDRIAQSGRGYTKKEVVWTPDSRRFALNYRISWWRGYETVAFYQLRDDKWVTLRSPVDEASKHSQLAQLARKYSPKNTDRKGDSALVSDHLEARSWTDANTLLLYAYSEEENGAAAAHSKVRRGGELESRQAIRWLTQKIDELH